MVEKSDFSFSTLLPKFSGKSEDQGWRRLGRCRRVNNWPAQNAAAILRPTFNKIRNAEIMHKHSTVLISYLKFPFI